MSSTLIPLWWAVLAIGSLFTISAILLAITLTLYRSERRFRLEAFNRWQTEILHHSTMKQSRDFLRAQVARLQDQLAKERVRR